MFCEHWFIVSHSESVVAATIGNNENVLIVTFSTAIDFRTEKGFN